MAGEETGKGSTGAADKAKSRDAGTETVAKIFNIIDGVVEMYLAQFVKPFLHFHEIFYNNLNAVLRKAMDDNKSKIPDWFTANFITYARTVLVIPCLLFISWGYWFLPSVIVLLVDFGDFLDGVAARYWIDVLKERQEKKDDARPGSPASSDASFGK
jgi:hypothetical protein